MSLHTSKRATTVFACLPDWKSKVEHEGCSQPRSNMQDIKALQRNFVEAPLLRFRMFNASKPCFNFIMRLAFEVEDGVNTAHLPFFIDNEVAAHAFDRDVPSIGVRGLVFNESVIGIMLLLGSSIWLLSETAETGTLLTFLCASCSSGTCPERIKGSVTSAAYLWILGNMIFALFVVDDMVSMISVPGNSRISQLQDCVQQRFSTETGRISGYRVNISGIRSTGLLTLQRTPK